MADIDTYRDKFTGTGLCTLDDAVESTTLTGKRYITEAHIIQGLVKCESKIFTASIMALGIDPKDVIEMNLKHVEIATRFKGAGIRIAPSVTDVFKRAIDRARSNGRWQSTGWTYLLR